MTYLLFLQNLDDIAKVYSYQALTKLVILLVSAYTTVSGSFALVPSCFLLSIWFASARPFLSSAEKK